MDFKVDSVAYQLSNLRGHSYCGRNKFRNYIYDKYINKSSFDIRF